VRTYDDTAGFRTPNLSPAGISFTGQEDTLCNRLQDGGDVSTGDDDRVAWKQDIWYEVDFAVSTARHRDMGRGVEGERRGRISI
jgi:hypothetical protein